MVIKETPTIRRNAKNSVDYDSSRKNVTKRKIWRTRSIQSYLRDKILKEGKHYYEYGLPFDKERRFLKFSYLDGAFVEKEQNPLFRFSIPKRLKDLTTSSMLRKALDAITPNITVEVSPGTKKLRIVSRSPTSKEELYDIKKMMDSIFKENDWPPTGICEERTEMLMDLFDELIRQVSIDFCPEAGQLLLQVRDHYRETLTLNRLLFQYSQTYAYRKQIHPTDNRKAELTAEMDSITRRAEELANEMRAVETGIVLNQERLFYRMVEKIRHYKSEIEYFRVAILKIMDIWDCQDPGLKDALGKMRTRELEIKRDAKRQEELRKKQVDEGESESYEEEEVEEEEAENPRVLRVMRAQEELDYNSEDNDILESESPSEEGTEEFSSTSTAASPPQIPPGPEDRRKFRKLQAVDKAVSLTHSDMSRGAINPAKEPVPIYESPTEGEEEKALVEEKVIEKDKVEDEEEKSSEEEQTEADKEKARQRKLKEMDEEMGLTDSKKDTETKDTGEQARLEKERLEKEKKKAEERKAREEALKKEEKKKINLEVLATDLEEEELEEEEDWGLDILEEGLEEEGEEGVGEDLEIVSSSSPSESEEEEQMTKKVPGKKRAKKSTIIVSKDLVDVEMGETETSDFEDDNQEDRGSQAS